MATGEEAMNGVEYRNRMKREPGRREGTAAGGIVRALPVLAALGVLALGVMQAGPARAQTPTPGALVPEPPGSG